MFSIRWMVDTYPFGRPVGRTYRVAAQNTIIGKRDLSKGGDEGGNENRLLFWGKSENLFYYSWNPLSGYRNGKKIILELTIL